MAAEFFRVFKMKGFDRYQNPRWQMVPVGGDRYVQLRDGAGLTVTSTDTGKVTLQEVNAAQLPAGDKDTVPRGARLFKLHGAGKGRAVVEAKNAAGATAVQLEVETKNAKTVHITFNFVRDSANHRTWHAPASVGGWLNGANYIYNGQANVFLRRHAARWVSVGQDLGTEVRRAAGAADERAAVEALGDSTADMNFFMVWEYESDFIPGTGSDRVDASVIGSTCFYENRAGNQTAETMAHEIGHFLGRPDTYDNALRHHLMYGYTDVRGCHLSKQDVNVMNP